MDGGKIVDKFVGRNPDAGTVVVEVHSWDYIFSLVYGVVLMICLAGVAKYAHRAQALTIVIMVTNVLAVACKSQIHCLH